MKIICIGRNYAEHAKELHHAIPDEPVFFLKPDTALIPAGQPFFLPDFSSEIHYEAEIVIKINRNGKHIAKEFAHKYYNEISIGIDFTARDIQQNLKSRGLPWEKAKAFDWSAPVGKFVPLESVGNNIQNIAFSLYKNNQLVQSANTSEMLFDVNTLISYVSSFITLKTGDLIFTGTPAGVDKVEKNDILTGYIFDKNLLTLKIK